MRELPITMTGKSVRAILAGTKTQTRRVIPHKLMANADLDANDPRYVYVTDKYGDSHHIEDCAPYRKGDLLWVREAWRVAEIYNRNKPSELAKILLPYNIQYDANEKPFLNPNAIGKPRSSRFMPKVFARIWLKVTDVRAERVQDITPDDARAEGHPTRPHISDVRAVHDDAARDWYMDTWDTINAKRDYPWKSNPWVWVYEFRRAEK